MITFRFLFCAESSSVSRFFNSGWLYLPAWGPDAIISDVGAESFTLMIFAPAFATASSAFSLASPMSISGKSAPIARILSEPF